MAQVILFGGGDGGGLVITSHGIRRIPPFDPLVRAQLAALSRLTRAASYLPNPDVRRQLGQITTKLTHVVLSQLEAIAGSIDKESGLVYEDPDGGFVCGSTGRPPIPIPVPPVGTLQQVIESGQLGVEELRFLEAAVMNKADIYALFEDPVKEAKRLNLTLSSEAANRIRVAHLSKKQLEEPVDKEVADFFHKTVLDGRFVREWAVQPQDVATKLGVKISDSAIDRIRGIAAVNQFLPPGSTVENPVAVAVAVAIVIMLVDRPVEQVIDASGVEKL